MLANLPAAFLLLISPAQLVLVNALPHAAAANPRAFRTLRLPTHRRPLADASAAAPRRNVLDGSLLWRFASLDARDQRRLALAIGTSAASALESLRAIDRAASILAASHAS